MLNGKLRWGVLALAVSAPVVFAVWSNIDKGDDAPLVRAAPDEVNRDFPQLVLSGEPPAGNPSSAERTAMEDGVVSWEEYHSLVSGTVACLEGAGFTVVHFTQVAKGLFGSTTALDSAQPGIQITAQGRIDYVASGGSSRVEGNAAAAEGCMRNSAVVEALWEVHTAPTESELQAGMDDIGECLRQAGIDVPIHPSRDDLKAVALLGSDAVAWGQPRLSPAYGDCEIDVAATTRLR
ncbi:MAG: hypothetical protein ACRDHF_06560 [Tepidiformaceae bacterium]